MTKASKDANFLKIEGWRLFLLKNLKLNEFDYLGPGAVSLSTMRISMGEGVRKVVRTPIWCESAMSLVVTVGLLLNSMIEAVKGRMTGWN